MMYEYKCPKCQTKDLSRVRADRVWTHCRVCEDVVKMRRVFSVNLPRPMQEHWNPTVQAPVSCPKRFADQLKQKSEEASIQTGHEHRFVPTTAEEMKCHVTNEGLDSTNAVRRSKGLKEVWV